MKWRCLICNYIHEGEAPPESCPVCGVDASNFVPVEEGKNSPEQPGEKPSWRCLVCGYIHKGDNPPDVCPVCGVDASHFEPVENSVGKPGKDQSKKGAEKAPPEGVKGSPALKKAIHAISYGLFVISASWEGKDNAQTANTCFQITADPVQIAIGINKNNLTHELISQSGLFGVSILDQNGDQLARRFGYRSGRELDKFEGIAVHRGESGILLLNDVLATLQAEVVNTMDAGTHTLFLGKVRHEEILGAGEPMTYAYFRSKKG